MGVVSSLWEVGIYALVCHFSRSIVPLSFLFLAYIVLCRCLASNVLRKLLLEPQLPLELVPIPGN